jgi:hypothetical protein
MTEAKIRDKAKSWLTQQQKVFASLYKRPQTRLMVSRSTGVPIQNICRYVSTFRKNHTVFVVKIDACPISGMKAEYLSTNPKDSPRGQIRMFD